MFDTLSKFAVAGTPFLFYTDYKGSQAHVYPLDELHKHNISYTFNAPYRPHQSELIKSPIAFETYKAKFDAYIAEIKQGNTYLGNLTQPTAVTCKLSLKEIFTIANAPYKLLVEDKFVCFSPEPFIKIENNTIHTFPMKGTIDAAIPNAASLLLNNTKEMAEHVMIVDLLRNDLSIVSNNVTVERFRYIEKIAAGNKELLHVSSHIVGTLAPKWKNNLGEIIRKLLPAGSISGTPKKKTVEILEQIEEYDRGYFSGIFGVFNGKTLQSAVMIRFIEQSDQGLIYKSGGGITLDSDVNDEYNEMIDKIYIP